MAYIVRLVQIQNDKVIKNEKNGTDILFDVFSFIRYDKVDGLPTNQNKDKWFRKEDPKYLEIKSTLIVGKYFNVEIDFLGKIDIITSIEPVDSSWNPGV